MSILNTKPTTISDSDGTIVKDDSAARGNVVTDGTNNRILIGYDKDGFGTGNDYGIKVSKAGYDVLTTGDANIVMSSAYNLFKIVATGSGTITVSGAGTYTVDIAHGLGTVPAFVGFGNFPTDPTNYYNVPFEAIVDSTPTVTGYSIYSIMRMVANSTNLRIQINAIGGITNGSWPYRYYIMQETST